MGPGTPDRREGARVFVDRYRYAKHPEVIAEATSPRLLSLFRHPRTRARYALGAIQARPEIARALAAFADDASRAVFHDVLAYRIWGPPFSRLAHDRVRYDALEQFMAQPLSSHEASFVMHDAMGEPVRRWSLETGGRSLEIDATKYGLYWAFCSDQYHFERDGVRVAPEAGDVLVDAGAYLGETAIRFALDVGPQGRVLSFDPFIDHVRVARQNAARNGLEDRVRFLPAGLAESSNIAGLKDLPAAEDAGASDGHEVHANAGRRMASDDARVALDDVVRWAAVPKVDFIKMDIEGSEIAALEGAHDVIQKYRPKLGISVYHRPSDLWAIPNLIREKYPFYQLYLDHHALYGEETVLYARPV